MCFLLSEVARAESCHHWFGTCFIYLDEKRIAKLTSIRCCESCDFWSLMQKRQEMQNDFHFVISRDSNFKPSSIHSSKEFDLFFQHWLSASNRPGLQYLERNETGNGNWDLFGKSLEMVLMAFMCFWVPSYHCLFNQTKCRSPRWTEL